MGSWQDRRIIDLFGIELPIVQAPMAGSSTPEMAIAVSETGGLGSVPAALYSYEQLSAALKQVRAATKRPINANFFTHTPPQPEPAKVMAWRAKLAPYYVELGLDPGRPARGIVNRLMRELGPLCEFAPAFPTAGSALAPLKSVVEKDGKGDFSNLWSGQSASLAHEMSAAELTRYLGQADD